MQNPCKQKWTYVNKLNANKLIDMPTAGDLTNTVKINSSNYQAVKYQYFCDERGNKI